MKPKDAKVRVIALSNDENTNQKLDAAAKEKIEGWQEKTQGRDQENLGCKTNSI